MKCMLSIFTQPLALPAAFLQSVHLIDFIF